MGKVMSYRDLEVWQMAMDLVEECYRLSDAFPKDERFGLTSQLRRAAVSIPSNIAEGHARQHTKEFLQFLSVARGSLAELETQLILAERLNFVTSALIEPLFDRAQRLTRMMASLKTALEKK